MIHYFICRWCGFFKEGIEKEHKSLLQLTKRQAVVTPSWWYAIIAFLNNETFESVSFILTKAVFYISFTNFFNQILDKCTPNCKVTSSSKRCSEMREVVYDWPCRIGEGFANRGEENYLSFDFFQIFWKQTRRNVRDVSVYLKHHIMIQTQTTDTFRGFWNMSYIFVWYTSSLKVNLI